MTATVSAQTRAETQIRDLISEEIAAICANDMDRLFRLYADDAVIFDVKPPYQTNGAAAFRTQWEACLPYLPATFQAELRDLAITASRDLAVAHWHLRFTGMGTDNPAALSWMRFSAGYRRTGDTWQIIHEHISVPYHPETGELAFALGAHPND